MCLEIASEASRGTSLSVEVEVLPVGLKPVEGYYSIYYPAQPLAPNQKKLEGSYVAPAGQRGRGNPPAAGRRQGVELGANMGGFTRVDGTVEPPSYLMRLYPDVYAQEQERVAQRFEEAVRLAEQAFVAEFAKLISHLTERLGSEADGQRRIFRDSVVTNFSEFFERFRHLNVCSNGDLDQLVQQAQNLVSGVTPHDLRDDAGLRQHIAATMTQVQTQLDELMVDRPRQQIIRSNPARNGGSHAVAH